MNSHLSGPFVTKWIERHSNLAIGTALHPSKDLAVSPFHFTTCVDYRKAHPVKDAPPFQAKSVSARTSRIAPDGRYPLPCYTLACVSVRTFLPCIRKHRSNYSVQGVNIIPLLVYFDNCSRKMVLSISGLAEPLVAFIPCPIKNCNEACLPALYSSTTFLFCSIIPAIIFVSSPASLF